MIQSVKKVFDILEYMSGNGNLVRLNDIASALDLQKTTVHNFLDTLKQLGYVEQDAVTPRYRITSKVGFLHASDKALPIIKKELVPVLEKVTGLTGETSYLAVQMGSLFRYEVKCEPERSVRISVDLGKEYDLVSSAIGKVFMAYSEHLQASLTRASSVTFKTKLVKEIEGIVKNGYLFDLQDCEPDMNCVVMPCFYRGRVVAVLGLSGPSFRFNIWQMKAAVKALQDLLPAL